ncbi:DEP domain-containing protein 1B-like isoform X2 [Stegodyphus dumicola]|uniref:DEP domain-containing protein 1B-like isoform X2 n=1 Tax=Stegodyphus dumicola TaxID=202533 RepID=UPI0015B20A29|nr:DEP domain-containing protein 1B-like isoform X2 [Stegodyphus dumicola]
MDNNEPYRATKLWNEVILAFRSGMPVKKHRHRIHTYSDCFTASEAVTWLHCYLLNNPNFGPDVTRKQTIHLLQKFLKCHVIESCLFQSKKTEFSDNSHLYRFNVLSPQQYKTLPLHLIQKSSPDFTRNKENGFHKENFTSKHVQQAQKENLPECRFVERKLSLAEIAAIWKSVTLSRLAKTVPSIIDILDENFIDGHVIKHNVSRLSKTGVVCLIDKTDDIPHWIISAMKCLANWPNASGSGSCLPNYPGFEKDVFKVVRDFFLNPQVPLLPSSLSLVLIKVFCHFMQSPFENSNNEFSYTEGRSNSSAPDVKTSTPVYNNDSVAVHSETENFSVRENYEGRLLLDDPKAMWDYPSVYFETDFETINPVTRMIPDNHIFKARNTCNQIHGSAESISTISVCSQQQFHTPVRSWNSELNLQDDKTPLVSQNSLLSSSKKISSFKSLNSSKQSRTVHRYSYSSCVYSNANNDLNTSSSSSKTIIATDEAVESNNGKFPESESNKCLESHIENSLQANNSNCISSHSVHSSQNQNLCASSGYMEEKIYPEELKSCFQLILLFLLPPNRRQLHLLLRVISKILKNGKLIFADLKCSMREYLLETFLPAIVQCEKNQKVIYEMVSFLLDNCEALLQPPSDLKNEVEEMSQLRRIKCSMDDTCFLTYCELVSKQQYEEQKVTLSTEALKDLLTSIMNDKNISAKERKKKLRQFKENHPEVYYLQFPEKLDEHSSKLKKSFLNRLVNLRI